MATSTTVRKDTPLFCVIEQSIDDGDYGEVLDLTHARTVYIHSTQALTYRLPAVDTNGAPQDHGDSAGVENEEPASDGILPPSATVAGRISENLMPSFLQLKNASGSTATVKIMITCHLHGGASVGESVGTAGARFQTGVGV